GDRFIRCQSADGGMIVNISGARTGERLGPGEAGAHHGLEHFGFDSERLETAIERLQRLGATPLEGPIDVPSGPPIASPRAPARLDVPYGPSPPETLDVFPAAGAEPAPVQVFIHGGYWRALDKSDFSFVARAFHLDAVVVVINYGLIPAVDMDELVRQCRQAL